MKLSVILLLTVTIGVLASWTYQVPIPEGFSSPWVLRTLHVLFIKIFEVARFLDDVGISKFENVISYSPTGRTCESDVLDIEDFEVDGVPVRMRTPCKAKGPLPAFIYYHGGAYFIGNRYQNDQLLCELSKDLQAVVISITYRLTPRYPWPAALEDSMKVIHHFFEHGANDYNIDTKRIGVGGDSAGGHLTVGVNLKLRDDNYPLRPKVQCLIYPAVQFYDFSLPSYTQNVGGPVLTRDALLTAVSMMLVGNASLTDTLGTNKHVPQQMQSFVDNKIQFDDLPEEQKYPPFSARTPFQGDNHEVWEVIKDKMTSPYLNPLMADDLSDQPPVFLFSAQYDVLRDDSYMYAKRLREAGVDVTHFNHPRAAHGIFRFIHIIEESDDLYVNMVKFLKEKL